MVSRVSESESPGVSPKAHHQLLGGGSLVLLVDHGIILGTR